MKPFQTVPRTRLHRWNRRQRKKLRLGEFQELGFTLHLSFHSPLDEAAYERHGDAIIERIEALGLCVGGLGGTLPIAETEGFVSSWNPGSVTPEQVSRLLEWCRARPEVKEVRAGELVDAWHGWGLA
ncbi:YggL family protein [Bordetella avium]|uniref:DUF469 family protein n=1 Tax=Bordetella avium (strain 197N) TaxID=360910 RepID=Q2KZH7_BORA1|nr:YggL family protein [Bordetella avium]AZY48012.1 DUF469 domain-containing protein [Bordetella avium]AZY51386.1 DUF469 domain-containing protein [Bordetella avium]RIQ18756.1 DUF469 family protein [Bordetella avium]RIQ35209.1 DUF469 family protein [Bordetella avium]RIQ53618.1 DUF469 family protein [Bordetella avium]